MPILPIYMTGYYSKEELDVIVKENRGGHTSCNRCFLKDHPEIYWLKFGEGGVGASYNIETIGSLIE